MVGGLAVGWWVVGWFGGWVVGGWVVGCLGSTPAKVTKTASQLERPHTVTPMQFLSASQPNTAPTVYRSSVSARPEETSCQGSKATVVSATLSNT